MRDGYLSHFGLREPPFSKEVPDMELWLPSSKQAKPPSRTTANR